MVFDLVGLALAVPTATAVSTGVGVAVSEAVRQRDKQNKDEQWQMRDFHLDVFCSAPSRKRDQVDKTIVVLKDGKLWLAPKDPKTNKPLPLSGDAKPSHPFAGFYMDFTQKINADPMFERLNKTRVRGLVSTISKNPPTLNWIYVDRRTMELRYGSREQAEGNLLGPFGWTDDETGLTLEHWEGFVAVEERKDVWAVYYDREDDGLRNHVTRTRVLQCSLERRVIEDESFVQQLH
jgi:hypothetical protein